MAYKRSREDYAAIDAEAHDPATKPTRVSETEYWEMLEVMPPIYVPGGFMVCEALTDRVHAHFAERNGRYYAKYAVLGRPETYIPRSL